MKITDVILTVIAAMSIPSAVTGFCVWRLQRKISERDTQREQKEADREHMELIAIKLCYANTALCEATAKAVQRIPDAHCNGDMHAALDYAKSVKNQLKDHLTKVGVHAMYDD